MSWEDASRIISLWGKDNLQNVRFSGGEPTLWKKLPDLVRLSKECGIKRVAISTNGSAPLSLYKNLIKAGVDDFSISLDSCCAATGNKMAGDIPVFKKVIRTIKELSKLTYVTVGVVITEDNEAEVKSIIEFADSLGVSDIRLITAAQTTKHLPSVTKERSKNPILDYRLANLKKGKPIRGISQEDNHKCPLVLDDMAIMNGKHYPCIIYLREHGKEIGEVSEYMRKDRQAWYNEHDCFKDEICRKNCLDVCVDYNNRVMELNKGLYHV